MSGLCQQSVDSVYCENLDRLFGMVLRDESHPVNSDLGSLRSVRSGRLRSAAADTNRYLFSFLPTDLDLFSKLFGDFSAKDHDWENDCVTWERDGMLLSKWMRDDSLIAIKDFEVRDDDVWVVTYPKSGTTWMQAIMSLVAVGGDEEKIKTTYMQNVPFIEMPMVPHYSLLDRMPSPEKLLDQAPSPRMIKTHLQDIHLPRQLLEKTKPKIIYVARNPKDVAVSFFHFHTYNRSLPKYTDWNLFYEDYKKDNVIYGSWFQHNLFWWKRRHHSNVLFLKYEDMKIDPKGAIIQVADFMGYKLSDDAINKIVDKSSFKTMKSSEKVGPPADKSGLFDPKYYKDPSFFIRKGVTGDWKNHFTVAQNEEFDEICKGKLDGTGLYDDDYSY
ncbi:sulfotransferase 1C2-like [Antedon mediterranea]|uniref:sulfotransferase 1C2-like n=1 Tax=Antedon mediterranea TaxID=105859 RepID=UPI003AF763A3